MKSEKECRLCLSCSGLAGSKKGNDTKRKTGNWGIETKRKNGTLRHTTEARQNISDGLKSAYASGDRVSWNEGLTSENDDRVAKTGMSRYGKLNPNYGLGFYKVWVEKYGKETADEMNENRIRAMVETNVGMPYHEWLITLTKKERYYHDVLRATKQQPIKLLENFEKRGRVDLVDDAYHLDHIISICYGYENGIPPKVIGDISNLRFIPAIENIKKGKHNG